MSWKFINDQDKEAASAKAKTLKEIEKWWSDFKEKSKDVEAYMKGDKDWDISVFMEETLQSIDPNLMWEFGTEGENGYKLAITPETERHLRPLVDTLIEMAPKLPGWAFYAYRQPENLEDTYGLAEMRAGTNIKEMKVFLKEVEGNFIDLSFESPDYKDEDRNGAFVATECLLGEEVLDKWVGVIDAVPKAEGKTMSLDAMAGAVAEAIEKIKSKLPGKPWHQYKSDTTWTGFTLEPDQEDDYSERLDMVAATSFYPEMWKAAHTDWPFDSERFSKFGETFCYLKTDSKGGQAESPESRDELANKLDAALLGAKLGCTIGGASGLRYSYIDLAVSDLEKAIPQIKQICADLGVADRSWLLFFDEELHREWVGMSAKTPSPYMVTEDQGAKTLSS